MSSTIQLIVKRIPIQWGTFPCVKFSQKVYANFQSNLINPTVLTAAIFILISIYTLVTSRIAFPLNAHHLLALRFNWVPWCHHRAFCSFSTHNLPSLLCALGCINATQIRFPLLSGWTCFAIRSVKKFRNTCRETLETFRLIAFLQIANLSFAITYLDVDTPYCTYLC